MRSPCRQFAVDAEQFLATHPGPAPAEPPVQLRNHAAQCATCRVRWQDASRSRRLLAPWRELAAEKSHVDPHFLTRLRVHIRQQQARPAGWRALRRLDVAGRDLRIAAVLFLCTLSAFVYTFQHIERPNADEAMVLDVPHLNPQHPSDDHVRPRMADVMLNLMNP